MPMAMLYLAALCNTKSRKYSYQVLEIIEKNTTTSYTHKNLKKGTYYKYIVQAYKMVDGKAEILATSKTMYSATTVANMVMQVL